MRDSASGFAAFRNSIQSPTLRAIADHWNRARGKLRIASWDQIGLSRWGEHLSSAWAFDYDRRTGDFTGRLAGSNIMVGAGRSFQGAALKDLHPPHVFTEVHGYLLRVVSGPACCRWSGKLFRLANQEIEGERIVLPMGGESGASGVLGATWYDYAIWRTPDGLEVMHDHAEWYGL